MTADARKTTMRTMTLTRAMMMMHTNVDPDVDLNDVGDDETTIMIIVMMMTMMLNTTVTRGSDDDGDDADDDEIFAQVPRPRLYTYSVLHARCLVVATGSPTIKTTVCCIAAEILNARLMTCMCLHRFCPGAEHSLPIGPCIGSVRTRSISSPSRMLRSCQFADKQYRPTPLNSSGSRGDL